MCKKAATTTTITFDIFRTVSDRYIFVYLQDTIHMHTHTHNPFVVRDLRAHYASEKKQS